MSKSKKIVITFLLTLFVAVVAVGVVGIIHYNKNKISFTVGDTLPDGQGKTARIVILAGQSNASGCSLDEYLEKNVSEEKYTEYKNGYDNVYINYLSGSNTSNGFVKCATLQGELAGGFGPELGLAEKMSEAYPDETIFIIKCAWGGTNLYSQWLSPSSNGKTGTLYKQFIAFVQSSLDYLTSKNYKVQIEGMCWMQGESDSFLVDTATAYEANLSNFVKDVRKKFSKYASSNGIAFVDAYIAALPSYWVEYELVNEAKERFAQTSDINVVIDTVSEGLTTSSEPEGAPDMAHYDSMSEIKLGYLFADNVMKFFD